jgi:hypothetical protein
MPHLNTANLKPGNPNKHIQAINQEQKHGD